MQNQFPAVIETKIGILPTALKSRVLTGQGKTREESKNSLAEAIALILEDRKSTLSELESQQVKKCSDTFQKN